MHPYNNRFQIVNTIPCIHSKMIYIPIKDASICSEKPNKKKLISPHFILLGRENFISGIQEHSIQNEESFFTQLPVFRLICRSLTEN